MSLLFTSIDFEQLYLISCVIKGRHLIQYHSGGKESSSDEMVTDSRVSGPNGKVKKNFLMKAFRMMLVA